MWRGRIGVYKDVCDGKREQECARKNKSEGREKSKRERG